MITNYFTLRALVAAWQDHVTEHVLADAFSQEPDELTLAVACPSDESMLRIGTRLPFQFIFRTDGYSKARRNVAKVFDSVLGTRINGLSIAHRDRVIYLDLVDGFRIQIVLFGPRANVFLVDENGKILEAFLRSDDLAGTDAPQPRPAVAIETLDDLRTRWKPAAESVSRAVASSFPLFDRDLAREVVFRAEVDPDADPALDDSALRSVLEAAKEVAAEMQTPSPTIYWNGPDPQYFSLIELQHNSSLSPERFETVDEAVRIFVRRSLARRRFVSRYQPIERALSETAEHFQRSAERMLDELSRESRADQYERWAHLLMAAPHEVPKGADVVELDDLFGGVGRIAIPLDPGLSAIENANSYYERARRTRRSREEAERRLLETQQAATDASHLLSQLRDRATDLRALDAFRDAHAEELARFLSDREKPDDHVPFRRFALAHGYEVWVGRNARQNDDLTFRHAQKYDLWMHARGVPGSHTVLRKPNRDAEPDKRIVETAASIAAYFSKARGSGLVPVACTERKYVTKPRGAVKGAVRIEREEVLIVEPRLPS